MSRTKTLATFSEKSSWTPKNHVPSNEKIFKERITLIKKWYAAWNEEQRWSLLEYILRQLNDDQLTMLHSLLHPTIPLPDHDFTRTLPRFLCMKIFSLLDPQSLCRAAQVCWYWKYLTEANEIWQDKCLRLGWFLPVPPQPQMYDCTLWKRHYIACVSQLHWNPPQPPSEKDAGNIDGLGDSMNSDKLDQVKKTKKESVPRHLVTNDSKKPWRDPDIHPADIHFNYGMDSSDFLLYSRFPRLRTRTNTEHTTPQKHTTLPSTTAEPTLPPPTALLHPSLLEKIRLGSPSREHTELSTLNKYQTENEISKTFYRLHSASPFPRLPPYFVHNAESGEIEHKKHIEWDGLGRESLELNSRGNRVSPTVQGSRSIVRSPGVSITTSKSATTTSTAGSKKGMVTCETSERCNKAMQTKEGLLSKAWQIPEEDDDDQY